MNSKNQIIDEILLAIKARFSLIWIMSNEEGRILEILADVGTIWDANVYVYDVLKGITSIYQWIKERPEVAVKGSPIESSEGILKALQNIESNVENLSEGKFLFVFPDFHFVINTENYYLFVRILKSLEAKLRAHSTSILFISRDVDVPSELTNIIHTIDIPLPDIKELIGELDYVLYGFDKEISTENKEKIAMYAKGLSLKHAMRIFSLLRASNEDFTEWINIITLNKKNILKHSGALEYFPPKELPNWLGGLKVLKTWLKQRETAFSKEAEDFGVEYPKGLALIGIPGTGKSLTAKYVANQWQMPLLRLDMGAIFGSYVGQSEENMRTSIKIAEAVSPCILWIDEIEKVTQTKGLDAGTASRVFATFLTWMQEKKRPVFVLATANDVDGVPPELLRKGRFDETFFLDIPTAIEREEIISIHLKNRKQNPRDHNINEIVKITQDMVGAEIEQLIKEVILIAFNDSKREPKLEDFKEARKRIIPMIKTQEQKIKKLKKWVDDKRAISASEEEKEEITGVKRPKI